MIIRDEANFASGILFVFVGCSAAFLAMGYGLGSPGRIGPGFFPLCLGVILAGLGLVLVIRSCFATGGETSLERWDLRSLIVILASVAVFAILLPILGLVAAIIGMVVVSSFADSGFRWITVLGTAAGLAGLCYLIFVLGLELQLPTLPDFG